MITRKLTLQLLLFFLIHSFTQAQNLVPNPSFEHTETYRAHFPNSVLPKDFQWWESNPGSADIYSPANETVPISERGFQKPEHGRNFLGLVVASSGKALYNEKVQAQLRRPMKKDANYLISFYVSLADNSAKESNCFEVGFTKRKARHRYIFNRLSVRQALRPDRNVYPADTGWVLVKGIYKATGKEKFVNLGNFSSKASWKIRTNKRHNNGDSPYAYYFFDDISVIEIPADYEETRKDSFQLDEGRMIPNEPEIGDSISIPGFQFTQNAPRVGNKMLKELNELADYLATNPFVTGELTLSQNAVFVDAKLESLLLRRENELEEYFDSKGISMNRIHVRWVNEPNQMGKFKVMKVLY